MLNETLPSNLIDYRPKSAKDKIEPSCYGITINHSNSYQNYYLDNFSESKSALGGVQDVPQQTLLLHKKIEFRTINMINIDKVMVNNKLSIENQIDTYAENLNDLNSRETGIFKRA